MCCAVLHFLPVHTGWTSLFADLSDGRVLIKLLEVNILPLNALLTASVALYWKCDHEYTLLPTIHACIHWIVRGVKNVKSIKLYAKVVRAYGHSHSEAGTKQCFNWWRSLVETLIHWFFCYDKVHLMSITGYTLDKVYHFRYIHVCSWEISLHFRFLLERRLAMQAGDSESTRLRMWGRQSTFCRRRR